MSRREPQVKQSTYPLRLIFFVLFMLVLFMGMSAGIQWAWAWVQKPTSLPIKQIRIEGDFTHVSPAVVGQLVQTKMVVGFFALHLSAAKQAILAFPWIAHVSFRRVWPNTLTVRCVEQQPIARFGSKGVLSNQGVVFFPAASSIPHNLPELNGPVDQAPTLLNFYNTTNMLAKLLNLSVSALQVDALQSWRLVLSNQVTVVMGRHDSLDRFKQFVTLYPKIAAASNQPIVLVDLRYPNGMAVQYQQLSTIIHKR